MLLVVEISKMTINVCRLGRRMSNIKFKLIYLNLKILTKLSWIKKKKVSYYMVLLSAKLMSPKILTLALLTLWYKIFRSSRCHKRERNMIVINLDRSIIWCQLRCLLQIIIKFQEASPIRNSLFPRKIINLKTIKAIMSLRLFWQRFMRIKTICKNLWKFRKWSALAKLANSREGI